jgi:serine/threonine protein kinase
MIATLRHRTGEEIQDRYRIEGELGAGAFGTVYRCRDKELNLLVAVKELHVLDDPSTAGHERSLALEQFRAEAIHLSQLRHPHIVSGHYQPHAGTWLICPVCGLDFRGTASCPEHGAAPVVLKQRHYLVMEYVAGPDLEMAARNAGGRLPVEVAVKAARQVVDALVHIHERGWVHRDIKPENIRLRGTDIEKSAAVLLDFGIATLSGAGGEFSTRPQKKTQGGGTWGYAPDDPRERLHPDARSDIHALGMTLYSVLCGRDPTEAGPLIEMRRSRPRLFNPEIPPILDELLVACIAFNPAQRPASARDVAQALAALDAPPPAIDLAPPSTSSTSPPPASTSPVANVALTVPFGFVSGETATNLTQLVRLCDKFPDEACDYLFHGDVAAWLRANGRPDEANRVDQIRSEYATQKRQGLEAFIQYTGILPPPTLSVEPESLDFGTLWLGQKREIDLLVHNPGRGHLFGLVRSRYST